jgi:hypothetical protein
MPAIPAAPIAAQPVVVAGHTGPTGPQGPSFMVTGMAAAEPAAAAAADQPLDVISAIADLTLRVKALEAVFGKR